MMVGRNPGINEDREGKPFVGRGGMVFQGWLDGLGVTREDIWLTNTLKCYTTSDRKPKGAEIRTCWDNHLSKEVEFCKPHFIVALGSEAFELLTGRNRLSVRHGIIYDMHNLPGVNAFVMGAIHPGSAMRHGDYRDMMIEDAKILKPLIPAILSGSTRDALPTGYESM